MGAHQKIDRVARRHLSLIIANDKTFPAIRSILQFEGRNGPDGIKIKSPAVDEPWHYFNPFDEKDTQLLDLIKSHYGGLVDELKNGNKERAAFEAAWLAHALVDGLTPAHHFPYEQKLTELMGGQGKETRTSVYKKNVLSGQTKREALKNNWRMWGPRGLRTGHGLFELGIATLIAPLSFGELKSSKVEVKKLREIGLRDYYIQSAREVAVLDLFEAYIEKGWTPKLAWQIRHQLGPTLIRMVTTVWYSAALDAGLSEKNHANH